MPDIAHFNWVDLPLSCLTLAEPAVFLHWSFVKVNKAPNWILHRLTNDNRISDLIKTFKTGDNHKHFQLLSVIVRIHWAVNVSIRLTRTIIF